MITLTIDNSSSQIQGLNTEQFQALKSVLSISEERYGIHRVPKGFSGRFIKDFRGVSRPVADSGVYKGYGLSQSPLLNRRGEFGTGLVYLTVQYLKKSGLKYQVVSNRKIPQNSILGPVNLPLRVTPYPEQIEALNRAVDPANEGRGIISAVTGFGKSLIIALLVAKLQVRTLIVVPNLALKRQLTSDLEGLFGKVAWITVQNVDGLDPKAPDNVDMVIIDEFHHAAAATYRKLNKYAWKDVYYRFGLTATPFRAQESERLLLESVLSEVIYRVTYQQAVDKGYIVPVEAYYIDLEPTELKGSPTSWPAVYSELIVNNSARNSIIRDLVTKLWKHRKSTICLVKEIEHGENLAVQAPFLKGENDDNASWFAAFNERRYPVMVGTTGVVGEGVDTRPCEYVIIAGLGKSKPQFMQQVGRGLRKYPGKESCKVILFRDPSHKWTLEHFKAQCKYLRDEYNVKAVKLET